MTPLKMALFLFALSAVAIAFSYQGMPDGVLEASLASVYGEEVRVLWQSVPIKAAQKETLRKNFKGKKEIPDSIVVGWIPREDHYHYLILDEAPGKIEKFLYAVYLDQTGVIVDVDVLVYREDYGGEIDFPAFRRQFRGKKEPREVVFGRSIQNITGATISVRSITYGVRDILVLHEAVLESLLPPPPPGRVDN